MKPTQYQVDKLARMAQANAAELAAVKAAHAAGTLDQRRVRKLDRAVNEQRKLERELARLQRLNGPDVVCAGCGAPTSLTKPICDKCAGQVQGST